MKTRVLNLVCALFCIALLSCMAAWTTLCAVWPERGRRVPVAEMESLLGPILPQGGERQGGSPRSSGVQTPYREPDLLYGVYDDILGRVARAYKLDGSTMLVTLEPWIGRTLQRASFLDPNAPIPFHVELEVDWSAFGTTTTPMTPVSRGATTFWGATTGGLWAGFLGPITYTVRAWDATVPPASRTPANAFFDRGITVNRLDVW